MNTHAHARARENLHIINCLTLSNYLYWLLSPVSVKNSTFNYTEHYSKAVTIASELGPQVDQLIQSNYHDEALTKEIEVNSRFILARSHEMLSVSQLTAPTHAKDEYLKLSDMLDAPSAPKTRKVELIAEDTIRAVNRSKKDCMTFKDKKFQNFSLDERRTALVIAVEEQQKNKHFNYLKMEFYTNRKGNSHWKHHWKVHPFGADNPKLKDKNLSIMNCSIFAPYPLPSELIRLGRESEESRESQEGEIEEASTETVVSVVSRSR